jgi:hypothetical protein
VTRCSLCNRPCVYEVEPAITRGDEIVEPAVVVEDVWEVVYRNKLVFPACDLCWGKWPDPWKRFPAKGFGRLRDERPLPELVSLDDFNDVPWRPPLDVVDVLRETAP